MANELGCMGRPVRLGQLVTMDHDMLNGYERIALLTDENTLKYCLPRLIRKDFKDNLEILSIPAGESQKNLATASGIWDRLVDLKMNRQSVLLNLGGGVITDLGGFVATAYLRGIDFIHIPTSLLSMTDAAIGGKNGVNFRDLKNYLGSVAAPVETWIDTDFLHTLPGEEWNNGLAEMIKHGLIGDRELFEDLCLLDLKPGMDILDLLRRSIKVKTGIVDSDPYEKGARKKLNFGHTLGHALESTFLQEGGHLPHGEAVAIGMIMESFISHRQGRLTAEDLHGIVKCLFRLLEPEKHRLIDEEKVINYLHYDKKSSRANVGFTLLDQVGMAVIDCQVEVGLVRESIDFFHQITKEFSSGDHAP